MKVSNVALALSCAVSVLVSTLGSCADTLLNVDFAAYSLVKNGPAATGQGSNDFWNNYTAPFALYSGLTNLKRADGIATTVGLTVQNGGGHTGFSHPDPMYQTACYAQDFGAITLTITNLPGGVYDFYLYGHAGDSTANSVFQLLVGGSNHGNRSTATNGTWSLTNWVEGAQYVVFRGVQVTNGAAPVVVRSHPGISGYTYLNGLQIASVNSNGSPPTILTHPSSRSVLAGEQVTFSVNADGSQPLRYQWRFNGTNLFGATNTLLSLTNVQLAAAGNYSVVVSNAVGYALSSNAVLTVTTPSGLDLLNVDFAASTPVKTGAAAIGLGTNDFWNNYWAPFALDTGLTNLKRADGATTTMGLRVQNGGGHTGFSHPDLMYQSACYAQNFGDITLTVTNLPSGRYDFYLYGHSGDNTANSVFQLLVGGSDYGNRSTATNGTWSLTNWVEGAQYVVFRGVQVTNGGAPVVVKSHPGISGYTYLNGLQIAFANSNGVAPVILTQPASRSVLVGEQATFSVSAGGSQPLSYQWRFNGTNLLGATNASVLLTDVQPADAGSYSVVVSNAFGHALSSNAALTVTTPPEVDLLNVDFAAYNLVKIGGAATGQGSNDFWNNYTAPFALHAGLTNLKRADGIATTVGLTVQNGGGHTAFSHPDAMYQTACYAQNLGVITLTITNLPGGVYDFYLYGHAGDSTANSVFQLLVGGNSYGNRSTATNGTWSLTNWVEGAQYVVFREVQVTNAGAPVVVRSHPGISGYTYLNGLQISRATPTAPSITAQPANQTVVVGGNAVFSVSANGSEPLAYQWRRGVTDLLGATNASLILTNVQLSDAGSYSVAVSNNLGSVSSSNALLTVNFPPALLRIVNVTATGGNNVTVPVQLAANGNENALGFSLQFDTSVLSFSQAALGSGIDGASFFPNTAQVANGRVGFAIALPAGSTLTSGTQAVVNVTFAVAPVTTNRNTAILLIDQPTTRQLSDAQAYVLPMNSSNGIVAIAATEYEADVSPRPGGDKALTITDWVQVGRFAAKLDEVSAGGEFQRADCAPRTTRGNGVVTVTDWVQAGRYVAGLDPQTPVAGPTSLAGNHGTAGTANGLSTRTLRILGATAMAGETCTFRVQLEGEGNENALGFSLEINPAAAQFLGASLGSGASGAILNINTNFAAAGQIGFVLALPTGSNFSPSNREIARIKLRVSSTVNGPVPLSFACQPVSLEISDPGATPLVADYVNSTLAVVSFPPALTIHRANTNVILSWPVVATNFVLQTNADVAYGSWGVLPVVPTVSSNQNTISLPLSPGDMYYRLTRP